MQGVTGLQRAVIQENAQKKCELLVEGEGLREVMTTDGEAVSEVYVQEGTFRADLYCVCRCGG